MIVVRECFVAKPGLASKLAAQLKDAATAVAGGGTFRVLTDLTGDFNRVFLEWEAADVADFDARRKAIMVNETFRAKMNGYTDLYITGSLELLQIT
ncbi:MAG: hypothetical protein AB7O32_11770 [Vicinamibacterales bacterium]